VTVITWPSAIIAVYHVKTSAAEVVDLCLIS